MWTKSLLLATLAELQYMPDSGRAVQALYMKIHQPFSSGHPICLSRVETFEAEQLHMQISNSANRECDTHQILPTLISLIRLQSSERVGAVSECQSTLRTEACT